MVARKKLATVEVAKRFMPPKKVQKQSKSTVLPDDYMERYEKRPDKLAVWEREGISRGSLDKFEVYYDSFSDRLVYPIRNPDGKIVNVGGRTLDPAWKEKGLRKYTYFMAWGELKTIYGLAENMEGIRDKDVCIMDDHNIKRLKQFVNVEYIWDKEDLLGDKDSPVDRGQDTWKKLYDGRLSWR